MSKRNPALVAIGVALMVIGAIVFIVSFLNLQEVLHTKTQWSERIMQDYQARTNATNAIPCYMFMALSAILFIAGLVMVVIKPRNAVNLPNQYPNSNTMNTNVTNTQNHFCSYCGTKLSLNAKFCETCGHKVI